MRRSAEPTVGEPDRSTWKRHGQAQPEQPKRMTDPAHDDQQGHTEEHVRTLEDRRALDLEADGKGHLLSPYAGTSSRTWISLSSPCSKEYRLNVTCPANLSINSASAGDGSP